jgi:hypothetical protein
VRKKSLEVAWATTLEDYGDIKKAESQQAMLADNRKDS